MKEPRIAIGGLLLPEVLGWTFSERESEIVGKPPVRHLAAGGQREKQGTGVLQIFHVPQHVMPQPVTHEYCMSVMQMVLRSAGEPTNREMKESVCGPFGAATFARAGGGGGRGGEAEVIRGWYCRRPPGMIYGLYSCRKSLAHGAAYHQTVAECAYIMSHVLFDRVDWGAAGADDPLTQVLLDNFARIEGGQKPS
jgi:hypothetical protein